ncbi:hypothetical protein MVEN_02370200 [Mycena venus]|uniref:DUF6534 domain-containing protein n=1 Tax=Mycena venus TaxID=2733690 RepID=A0A8H6X3G0_9AGAR|nr:hypothetical protein MVEN_02370200 [Mycena venus]
MLLFIILTISVTSVVAGIITGVFSFQGLRPFFSMFAGFTKFLAGDVTHLNNRKTSTAVGIWCGGAVLSDIPIAIFMTYYLAKNDTGFRQTHVLISKLIRLTIETGAVTGTEYFVGSHELRTYCLVAVVALTNLILLFAFPGRVHYTTPALIMPKLYANTIIAVLNARLQIVGGRITYASTSDFTEVVSSTSFGRPDQNDGSGRSRALARNTPVVAITKEVFSDQRLDERVEMKAMERSRDDVYRLILLC